MVKLKTAIVNKYTVVTFVAITVLVAVLIIFRSRAASVSVSYEAEDGTPLTNAQAGVVDDISASGGKYFKFGTPNQAQFGEIFITSAELMSKPTSGAGWNWLKTNADLASWGTVNLADQDSVTQTNVLAGALVYARTGDTQYRDKVISYVKQVCGTEIDGTDQLLNLARTLFGYVVSAEMVQMPHSTLCNNGTSWSDFLASIRTKVIPGNSRWSTLEKTSGDTSSNWGAYALSSHLAVSYALNDTAAIARDITIFKRVLGDTSSSASKFNPTSSYNYNNNGATWDMTPTMQRGINPDVAGDERNGALIEDALRSVSGTTGSVPCCTVQSAGIGYQEESLDGILSTLQLFRAHGIDLRADQSNAVKRAFAFYITHGGPGPYSSQRYIPYAINYLYDTTYPTQTETKVYRHLGYGSWLFTK